MNLEQIKQKQLELNNLLQVDLIALEEVVDRITGCYDKENIKAEEVAEDSGLLEEINSAQKSLERKIDNLNILRQRLYNGTFEPVGSCANIKQ